MLSAQGRRPPLEADPELAQGGPATLESDPAEWTAEQWEARIRPHLEGAVGHIVAAGRKLALGFYIRTPAVRRARAVDSVLMALSMVGHDALWRHTYGRGVDLGDLAQALRNLADDVDSIEDLALLDYPTLSTTEIARAA